MMISWACAMLADYLERRKKMDEKPTPSMDDKSTPSPPVRTTEEYEADRDKGVNRIAPTDKVKTK